MNKVIKLIIGGTLTVATLGAAGHVLAEHEYGSGYRSHMGSGYGQGYGNHQGMYGQGYGHHGYRSGEGKRHNMKNRMDHMSDYLELTDKQRKSLEKIFEAAHEKQGDLKDALHDLRRDIRDAMDEDTINIATISSLADQQGKLIADKIKLRAKTWKQARTQLDEKQRKRMRRMDHHSYGYWNH